MKRHLLVTLLCFGLARFLTAQTPQMNTVQPDGGKIGAVLRVYGVYLGKAGVDEVYLTDHTLDMMVKILEQKDDMIEFRIPPSVKPGRLQLLVKTPGKRPMLLEQPAYVMVEGPAAQHEIVDSHGLPDTHLEQAPVPILSAASGDLTMDQPASKIRSTDLLPISSGRLIWTGTLQKNAQLSFSPTGASEGVLNGRLPGGPVKISIPPVELVDGGIAVYSKDRQRLGSNEPPSAWNGWKVVVRDGDPKRIAQVNILEAPGPGNEWKHLVLRNGNHSVFLVVVEWQRVAEQ